MPIVGIINSWEDEGGVDQNLLHIVDDYRGGGSALNFRKTTGATTNDMWRRTSTKSGFKRQSPMAALRQNGEISDFCNTSIVLKENAKEHLFSPLQ